MRRLISNERPSDSVFITSGTTTDPHHRTGPSLGAMGLAILMEFRRFPIDSWASQQSTASGRGFCDSFGGAPAVALLARSDR